jgi:hypothetical protein
MNFKELIAVLRKAGHKPYPYSGRFMFGRQCVAITVRRLQREPRQAPDPHSDDMGLDKVLYWPEINWVEESEPTAMARIAAIIERYNTGPMTSADALNQIVEVVAEYQEQS